jgi:hypothetical protein
MQEQLMQMQEQAADADAGGNINQRGTAGTAGTTGITGWRCKFGGFLKGCKILLCNSYCLD